MHMRVSKGVRTIVLTVWLAVAATAVCAQQADVSIRAELAAPLQDVQRLFRDKQFPAALKALSATEAIANRTEDENILIERLRAATAVQAGDLDQAVTAYERLVSYTKVPETDKVGFLEVLTTLNLKRRSFTAALAAGKQYLDAGGKKPSVRLMMAQAAFFANQPAQTVEQTHSLVQLARKAGVSPERDVLILQANAQQNLKDNSGYMATLETLIEFYPQPAYWTDLLGRVQSSTGFSQDLLLDLYRLQFATGSLGVGEALEMSQLSIKQGFPLEAVRALKQAQSAASGSEETRQIQQALQHAEQLVATDASVDAQAQTTADGKVGGKVDVKAAGKANPSGGAALKGGVKASASAEVKPQRQPGFSTLYQRWLLDNSAQQADALAAGLTAETLTPLNRLRLGAVRAQSGQREQAATLFEGLASGSDSTARLASLWLLSLKKAPTP